MRFALLDDNFAIRIWDGHMSPHHFYCFDFVNRQGQYILTPHGLKIYAEATEFSPGGEVLSMEASVERAMAHSAEFRTTMDIARDGRIGDPNWETYLIPEGTRLRFIQPGKEDCFLSIPFRNPPGTTLILRPNLW